MATSRQLHYAIPSANVSVEVHEVDPEPSHSAPTSAATQNHGQYFSHAGAPSVGPSLRVDPLHHQHRCDDYQHSSFARDQDDFPPQHHADIGDAVAERILETLKSKDECIAELERTVAYLRLERRKLQERNDDMILTQQTLHAQVSELLREVQERDSIAADRDAAKAQSERYAQALDDANRALALQLDALGQQTDKCTAAEAEAKKLESLVQSLESKIVSLKLKNQRFSEELSLLGSTADRADARVEELRREHSIEMRALQDENTALRGTVEEKVALEVRLEHSQEALRKAHALIKKLESRNAMLTADLERTRNENDSYAFTADTQRSTLEVADATLMKTESVASEAVRELHAAQATIQALEVSLTRAERSREQLAQERHALQLELDKASTSIEVWQERCAAARAEVVHLQDSIHNTTASYEVSVSHLQQEVDTCRRQLETQAAIIAARKEFQKSVTSERESLSCNVEELEDTLEEAHNRIRGLKSKLAASSKECDGLKQELRRTHVLHSAEVKDIQELSFAAATKQSEQLHDMSRASESLCKRLIAAEEELAKYTERCLQLQKMLDLREKDVDLAVKRNTALHKKSESLTAIAIEKEHNDAQIRQMGVAQEEMTKRISELEGALASAKARARNMEERSRHQESSVARSREVEEELTRSRLRCEEVQSKLAAAEKSIAAKQESLRSLLDERQQLKTQLHDAQQQLVAQSTKHREELKRKEDAHRSFQNAAASEASRKLSQAGGEVSERVRAEVQSAYHAAHAAFATDLAQQLFNSLLATCQLCLQSADEHKPQPNDEFDVVMSSPFVAEYRSRAERLITRVTEKYERDVEELQTALQDARCRCEDANRRAYDAISELKRREKRTLAEQQKGDGSSVRSLLNMSSEVRATAHQISQELLGLSGGLEDLVAMQHHKAMDQSHLSSSHHHADLLHDSMKNGPRGSAALLPPAHGEGYASHAFQLSPLRPSELLASLDVTGGFQKESASSECATTTTGIAARSETAKSQLQLEAALSTLAEHKSEIVAALTASTLAAMLSCVQRADTGGLVIGVEQTIAHACAPFPQESVKEVVRLALRKGCSDAGLRRMMFTTPAHQSAEQPASPDAWTLLERVPVLALWTALMGVLLNDSAIASAA